MQLAAVSAGGLPRKERGAHGDGIGGFAFAPIHAPAGVHTNPICMAQVMALIASTASPRVLGETLRVVHDMQLS